MNTPEELHDELRKHELSERILQLLTALIDIDNYTRRTTAKKDLIEEGPKILPVMHKLTNSDHSIIRKEAMKVIEIIHDKSSTEIAIHMLDDSESDIRWIAAETLIKIGRSSVRPLLEALHTTNTSINLRQGGHHVLHKLVKNDDPKELKELVHILKPGAEPPEIIPGRISNILNNNLV